ncbi:MAG TPA: class I SAM-dependent methyltransferase [Solirubrobacteraceae bacterium]|nr:class I SAM-dependent methyltransferase [Solirubrobacteraceae bacterium]
MEQVAALNEEAVEAWNGPLYERFVAFRPVVTTGLGAHGEAAIACCSPRPGERVLDIGCGFGDTTQRLGELVGPTGSAVGIDAAERFIETAREEARSASAANVEFLVGDVQVADVGGPFDYAFSRFGTMFFASPVAAMRNVRRALVPGGRLCIVVWRRKLDNDWMYRGETIVKGIVDRPEEFDEPTCGPGPFSMADADTTSDILLSAGFEDVTLRRCDIEITIGATLDEAIDILMALGPAGEVLRLQGDRARHLYPQIDAALREGLAEFVVEDGVRAPASTWIVTASAGAAA